MTGGSEPASADAPSTTSEPNPIGGVILWCEPATGRVVDPWGEPLQGVTVKWDGLTEECDGASVLTDADGRYSLPVEVSAEPTRILVTSTRTTTERRSVKADVVDPTGNRKFILSYLTKDATASPRYARTGDTVALSVRTSAPRQLYGFDHSHVIAELPVVGPVVMTPDATDADGWTTWRTAQSIDAMSDGAKTVTMCATMANYVGRCTGTDSTGSVVSTLAAAAYTVDNAAPSTAGGRISPLSGGNVLTSSAVPLSVRVTDASAGVAPSGVTFTLTDHTSGAVTTHTAATQAGAWYRTAPIAFTTGHLYHASVTARDRAGNETTVSQAPLDHGGGFLAVSVPNLASTHAATTARSLAHVPEKSCSVTPGPGTLERTITCTDVRVQFPSAPLEMTGTRHGGTAFLTQVVSLAGLTIQPTLQGASVGQQPVHPLPDGTSSSRQRFSVGGPRSGPFTVATDAAEAVIPEVTVVVTGAVDGATIDMPETLATASTDACAGPGGAAWCSPDPLPPVTDGGNQPVTDVIPLAGGRVVAAIDGREGFYVGPYGSVITKTIAAISDSEMTLDYGVDTGEGSSEETAEQWRRFKAAGWTEGSAEAMSARYRLGATLDEIEQRAVAGEYGTSTTTSSESDNPTPPAGDWWSSGCLDETEKKTPHYHGRGCWFRYYGEKVTDGRYLGDKSFAYAVGDNEFFTLKELATTHRYVTGEVRKFAPASSIRTNCGDVTISLEAAGIKMEETRSVCSDELRPHAKRLYDGKGDLFEARWINERGSSDTQNSEAMNVLFVPNAPSGKEVASGFTYNWTTVIKTHCFCLIQF